LVRAVLVVVVQIQPYHLVALEHLGKGLLVAIKLLTIVLREAVVLVQ
jgi:hypothetical protein